MWKEVGPNNWREMGGRRWKVRGGRWEAGGAGGRWGCEVVDGRWVNRQLGGARRVNRAWDNVNCLFVN